MISSTCDGLSKRNLLLVNVDLAADFTEVKPGDTVTLVSAMDDGLTYTVLTPNGNEIWKDRDLYYFAAVEEDCEVIESYGSEVLLFVPIMNARYWFTVERTNNH